uniref:Uncharacterized protein n=1 Tax=Ditylenchus dipsaci TaxID=166011 RepID=A0A915E4T9_9BILA
MLFLQITFVSFFNFTCCVIFVYSKYVSISELIIHINQFVWFFVHGFPPVIYLTLNKTIQDDSIELFNLCIKQKKLSSQLLEIQALRSIPAFWSAF